LESLLSDLRLTLQNLTHFPNVETIPEIGTTFLENASLKARGYARQTRMLTLADDSGLAVDALSGAPGVFSARFGGEGASDAERTAKLLDQLATSPPAGRTARFVSVIVIADPEGSIIHTATGICEGLIAEEPRGSSGFGYDPIFIPNGHRTTFGELPVDIKNRISHRALALAQTRDFLRFLTESSPAG
jgi:XTP/dITP diphosphohydrolase